MKMHLLKFLLLNFIVLLAQIQESKACLEDERRGLLELKSFLQFQGYDTEQVFVSWVDDDPESDCCGWERVSCNNTTGRVIQLSLYNLRQQDPFPCDYGYENRIRSVSNPEPRGWNITLLKTFEELRILDLSNNAIDSWIQNQGSKDFITLQQLETLDLTCNNFRSQILLSSMKFPSLKNLILRKNFLEASFPARELANLKNLEELDLGFNYLSGGLPIKDLITFERLEILDFSHNDFVGNIPPFIGRLSSLKALYLSSNQLNGALPNPGLCEFEGLQILDISYNNLEGTLPSCLNNLTSLVTLDLSGNLLSGPISPYLMSSPKSLQYIDFRHNVFEGPLVFSILFNHSKLEVVKLGSTEKKLQIDIETNAWTNPQFQMKALGLSNCDLKGAPSFLLNQHRLIGVDLSHNYLNGKFPSWLLENNTDLEFLNLRNNSFIGQFHVPEDPMSRLIYIDVSNNNLGGPLPKDLGLVLPNLIFLNFSENHFEGDLPSMGGMRMLEELDLSSNNFSGQVPKDLAQNCTRLRILLLSNNNFRGEFFSSHFNLTRLAVLRLRNNQFTGSLSNIMVLPSWIFLDVSNNNMSGEIPSWINNIAIISMRNNYFEGQLPCDQQRPNFWQFIDLSHNFLSGPLSSCSFLGFTKQIHLEGNNFTGKIPDSLFVFTTNLLVLNLRGNKLSGNISTLINALPSLRVLLLGNNRLSGSIPMQMCQLRNLSITDLSNNAFSGSIPSCLSNITFGITGGSYESIDQAILNFGLAGEESPRFSDLVQDMVEVGNIYIQAMKEIQIDFVTKQNLLSYKNDILNYMSGLDLSCNNLTGEIPESFGKLSSIRALNLSHNHLIGSIPVSFSNLRNVESLDLSYNNLSGKIPLELVNLNFLAVFSVAHNNLSGKIPDNWQFSTFNDSSYEGNPFLSGLPSEKNRTKVIDHTPVDDDQSKEKWYEIDHTFFFGSFIATYFVFLLGFGALLYINPYWRRRWFYFIEEFLYSTYYFVVDTFRKLSACNS